MIDTWLERIDRIEHELAALARPLDGLTDADPNSGERWEAAQVWGHLSEFIEFWIEVFGDIIDEYQGEPIPFGRSSQDPSRLAGPEHGKATAVDRLWAEVRSDLADLRSFLSALPESAWSAAGLHPTEGKKQLADMVEAYLVGHLEEHLAQLQTLQS